MYGRGDSIMGYKQGTKQNGVCTQARMLPACPTELETLKTGMICCLLDEDLTFQWGNVSFFDTIGYSREDFCNSYDNLRQYYANCFDEYALIQQKLLHTAQRCGQDIEMTIRLPHKKGGYSWVHLYGTIQEDFTKRRLVLRAEFAGVDTLTAEKEEQERLCQQKLQYFHWMLDAYEGNVYVSDINTYELLYLNQHSCDVLGMPVVKVVGRKCYEVIQGRTSPCPFCTNAKLTEDSFYSWEFNNPVLGRTFMIKNRIINWEGRRARLELSHDSTA